jgi:hypothetical protein
MLGINRFRRDIQTQGNKSGPAVQYKRRPPDSETPQRGTEQHGHRHFLFRLQAVILMP